MFKIKSSWSTAHVYEMTSFLNHANTMFGLCWDHVWPSFTCRPDRALKFSTLDLHGLRPISLEFLFLGPCQAHVGTMFGLALLQDQLEQCSFQGKTFLRLSKHGLMPMSMKFLILGTMPGQCWGHIWPIFTSRPPRALQFSRLSQHGLRPMSTECLLFRTTSRSMFGPCRDHVWPSLTFRPARALKF